MHWKGLRYSVTFWINWAILWLYNTLHGLFLKMHIYAELYAFYLREDFQPVYIMWWFCNRSWCLTSELSHQIWVQRRQECACARCFPFSSPFPLVHPASLTPLSCMEISTTVKFSTLIFTVTLKYLNTVSRSQFFHHHCFRL